MTQLCVISRRSTESHVLYHVINLMDNPPKEVLHVGFEMIQAETDRLTWLRERFARDNWAHCSPRRPAKNLFTALFSEGGKPNSYLTICKRPASRIQARPDHFPWPNSPRAQLNTKIFSSPAIKRFNSAEFIHFSSRAIDLFSNRSGAVAKDFNAWNWRTRWRWRCEWSAQELDNAAAVSPLTSGQQSQPHDILTSQLPFIGTFESFSHSAWVICRVFRVPHKRCPAES